MINLLIADDEPLVQAGIKSMLNWEEYGVRIAGVASNGAIAYKLIEECSPEIVITDIKMPVMSGLELAKKCYEDRRRLPVFIILTSYEEFQFVKEAIVYQVLDYLVKLELTPESLGEALKRAILKVNEIKSRMKLQENSVGGVSLFREQFFTRLLFNLFESEHQLISQIENLKLDLNYAAYAAAYVEINSNKLSEMSQEKQLGLYSSSLQMTGELVPKYLPCHILSLDMKHFAIVFFLKAEIEGQYKSSISNAIEQTAQMLYKYYSVAIRVGVGAPVCSPLHLSSSFQDAKQVFSLLGENELLKFMEDMDGEGLKSVFSLSLFKDDLRRAYDELDEKALHDILTSIMELFENNPTHYVQALDAAGNILYLSRSLLSHGEQLVDEVFHERSNGYRSLYELTSVGQIVDWLRVLRDGLCEKLAKNNGNYRNHIVANVKKYINGHVEERLSLNKVAEVFNISSNYLSTLFSKYSDIGFNDYINQSKIEAAKKMIAEGNLKIYEISDRLGFESAFYFSRVFKKITGKAPRDYFNQQ